MGRGDWWAPVVHRVTESDMTERLTYICMFFFRLFSITGYYNILSPVAWAIL